MNQLSCRSPYSASHLPPAGHVTGHVTNNNTRHYTANSWSSASCTSLHSYWPIPYTTVYFIALGVFMPLFDFWNSCGFNGLLWSHCCEVIRQNCTCLPEKAIFTCEHADTLERGVHNVKRYFDSTLFHPKWLAIAHMMMMMMIIIIYC